jgi:hypothetical protein
MIEAMEIKILHRGPHSKFHENLLISSNVIIGGHTGRERERERETDRENGDLASLHSFLESRLNDHIKFSKSFIL